jgi:hypothetical protein
MRYSLRTLLKWLFPPSDWESVKSQRFGAGLALMMLAAIPLGYGAQSSHWPIFWIGIVVLVVGECIAFVDIRVK